MLILSFVSKKNHKTCSEITNDWLNSKLTTMIENYLSDINGVIYLRKKSSVSSLRKTIKVISLTFPYLSCERFQIL